MTVPRDQEGTPGSGAEPEPESGLEPESELELDAASGSPAAADESSSAPAAAARDGGATRLELKPMEIDVVLIVWIGTALFAVAFLILFAMHTSLEHDGRGRWPWIALSGFVLGLMGLVYSYRRAQRISKVNAQ